MRRLDRPHIVTAYAVLQLVHGVYSLSYGLWALSVIVVVALSGVAGNLPTSLVLVVWGSLHLACGVGLWKVKPYGRTFALVFGWLAVLGLARLAIASPRFPFWLTGTGLPWIPTGPIAILMLVYFYNPRIKTLFSKQPVTVPTASSEGVVKGRARS